MNSNLSAVITAPTPPVKVLCHKCNREPDFFRIDQDPILFRDRIYVQCHDEDEIVYATSMLIAEYGHVPAFRGDL